MSDEDRAPERRRHRRAVRVSVDLGWRDALTPPRPGRVPVERRRGGRAQAMMVTMHLGVPMVPRARVVLVVATHPQQCAQRPNDNYESDGLPLARAGVAFYP